MTRDVDVHMPCIDADPEIFHPEHTGWIVAQAKKVCEPCPVKLECLADALENDEWGIWGGTTRRERNKMKKRHYDA